MKSAILPSQIRFGFILLTFSLMVNALIAYDNLQRILHGSGRNQAGQFINIELMSVILGVVINLVALLILHQWAVKQFERRNQIEKSLKNCQVGLSQDIERCNHELAQRLQTQQALGHQLYLSEQRLAGILDIAGDAIITIDEQQKIMLFNQAAEQIFGFRAQEVIGQSLNLLILEPASLMQQAQVLNSKGPLRQTIHDRQELLARRKNEQLFPAEASISRLKINKEVLDTVVLRDISERKYLEQLKNEFIAIVSHELKTPMTSIHGSLKILNSGLVDTGSEQGQRLLTIATASTDRLVSLINQILELESYSSNLVNHILPCSIRILLEDSIIELQQSFASERDVQLQLCPSIEHDLDSISNDLQVLADPKHLNQVIHHLIRNAIQFSPPHSMVIVQACVKGDQVLTSVQDQGKGIAPEKLEAIFDRFYQLDSSTARTHEGPGLGLAICRKIIEALHGQIWAESQLGMGSTFYFTLPQAIPPSQPQGSPTSGILIK